MKPTSIEVREHLQEFAKETKEKMEAFMGEKICITVVIFTEESMNYVTSTGPEENVYVLKQLVDYFEKKVSDIPAH